MSSIGRAFVAVDPPAAVLAAVEARVARVVNDPDVATLRWTPPEQWHATLQFLGQVGDADAMVQVLERAARDVEPFTVQLGGGGAFPKMSRGSVLWLGVADGAAALGALAGVVGVAAAELGFAPDDVRYRPHLTLARRRPAGDLRPVVQGLGDEPVGPAWSVDEIVLFASVPRAGGGHDHSVISRVPLRRSGSP